MSKILSVALATGLSFMLFLAMTWMIKPAAKIVESPLSPTVNITYKEIDDKPKEKERVIPEFEEPKLPKIATNTAESQKPNRKRPNFQRVAFNTESVVVGTIAPSIWGGSGDKSATPKVRINPRYPRIAATQGIEGFVTLTFDINEMGATENISIVEQKPRGIFAKAARKALSKWKYQPKMENNVAIAQPGQKVTLEFNLEKEML